MLHALRADQPVGNALDIAALPLNHKHFEAIMRIEMHMERGDDLMEGLVLHVGKGMFEFSRVVIIDDRDRTHRFL